MFTDFRRPGRRRKAESDAERVAREQGQRQEELEQLQAQLQQHVQARDTWAAEAHQYRLLRSELEKLVRRRSRAEPFAKIVPIGSDCFVRATVEDTSTIVLYLGLGIHAEMPIDRALEILPQRTQIVERKLELTQRQIDTLSDRIHVLIQEEQLVHWRCALDGLKSSIRATLSTWHNPGGRREEIQKLEKTALIAADSVHGLLGFRLDAPLVPLPRFSHFDGFRVLEIVQGSPRLLRQRAAAVSRTALTLKLRFVRREERVVVGQRLPLDDVPQCEDADPDVAVDIPALQLAIWIARMVDEAGDGPALSRVDVVAARELHDIHVLVVRTQTMVLGEALPEDLIVDDLPQIFHHQGACWHHLQGAQPPTAIAFTEDLILHEALRGESPISAALAHVAVAVHLLLVRDSPPLRPIPGALDEELPGPTGPSYLGQPFWTELRARAVRRVPLEPRGLDDVSQRRYLAVVRRMLIHFLHQGAGEADDIRRVDCLQSIRVAPPARSLEPLGEDAGVDAHSGLRYWRVHALAGEEEGILLADRRQLLVRVLGANHAELVVLHPWRNALHVIRLVAEETEDEAAADAVRALSAGVAEVAGAQELQPVRRVHVPLV
eukprot:scaffold2963_cov250-Pinguiococcus_pyrenoidosus.AAC.22